MTPNKLLLSGAILFSVLGAAAQETQAQHRGPMLVRNSDRCLEVIGPQVRTNGGRVQLGDCTGRPNQIWRREQGRLINEASNRCLDLHGPDIGVNGGRVQVYDCNGAGNQIWRHERGALVVQADGRCLDLHGRDAGHNGGRVQSWDCHFGGNQQWLFEPIGGMPVPVPSPPPAPPSSCESRLGPFAWSCSRPVPQMSCEQIVEPSDPHTWGDNFFCSDQPLGMRWSNAGPISGMRCTQIAEPSDPHTWGDNFLCLPHQSPYRFQWSNAGPIPGLSCIQWHEPADPHTWQDNFLCWTERAGAYLPPPPPPPLLPQDVPAGPIWNNDHAARRCPEVCQPPLRFRGAWRTTVPGSMSVCRCEP